MPQPTADSHEDAVFKAAGSFLVLWIAPAIWPFLDMLKALVDPAHGIFEWMHKGLELFGESQELMAGAHDGTLWEHLKEGYEFVAGFAVLVVALFLAIAILSLMSRALPRHWASPIEAVAAALWLIPYWFYKVVAGLMLLIATGALIGGLGMAVIQMFRTAGFFSAVFGSLLAIGFFMLVYSTVCLGFWATLSPPYLCLRYVVPFGLIWAQPDGVAGRKFHSAFGEGSHFPFWMGD